MGNCVTSCLPACRDTGALCNLTMLSSSRNDFTYLVEENSTRQSEKRSFLSRIFERRKNRHKKQPKKMVEGLLNTQLSYDRLSESQRVSPQSLYNCRDIQLQYLDANALLGQTNTSTPENSIDLEWEHETLPISIVHEPSGSSWTASVIPEDTLTTLPNESPAPNCGGAINTESDWSRVSSSANSLEWDSVLNSIQSENDALDTDTQFLLNEIDRLTMKALNETGPVTESAGYLDDTL